MDASSKRLVLIACILGTTVASVDATIVNVALPAIERDLGGGFAGQQWTANAYLVTLSALILIGGSLGDLYGERRIFAIGVGGFGATSLLCALAPTIETLVVSRALQGAAGALLTPAALAVIVAVFAEDERGRAIGAWTAWGAIGFMLGPLAGGQIIDLASWRWAFAINLPLVAITLVLIRRALPAVSRGREHARPDITGAGLTAFGLAAVTFGLIRQPEAGFADASVFVPLAAGAASLAGFLAHERRTRAPMLPLALFRSRNFAVGNAETLLMYAGLALMGFFLVLYLQNVAGYSATAAGAASLPLSIIMFAGSSRAGALADRHGPRLFMGAGPLVGAAGLALLVRAPADPAYVTEILPAMVIFAIGLTMTVAPLTATVLAGAEADNAGIASGVNNAIARLAGLLAVAALGAAISGRYGPGAASSLDAFRFAMGASAVLLAAGGLLGLIGIENPARADRDAGHCPGGQLAGAPGPAAAEAAQTP